MASARTDKTSNKVHNVTSDTALVYKDLPMNGKLFTAVDGTLIGPSDYSVLTNYEYTDGSIKAISGMTKVNTVVPTYSKHRKLFQFDKTNPNETHLLSQSYNSAMNKSVIQQMTQSTPDTGNFDSTILYTIADTWTINTSYSIGDKVLPTTSNGYFYVCTDAGTSHSATEPTWPTTEFTDVSDNTCRWMCRKGDLNGTFSKAPDGCMAYANGDKALIWGGDNYRVAKFLNYDPLDVFFYDLTDRVVDSSADQNSIATLTPAVGGVDSSTDLLLHFTDNLTDSSSNEFTVTSVAAAAYTGGRFSRAYVFDGSNDVLTVPDDAVFDTSGGSWTIDLWLDVNALPAAGTIFYQGLIATPTDDYMRVVVDSTGAIVLGVIEGGVVKISLSTGPGYITTGSGFQHVEISESGNDYRIFIGGTERAFISSSNRTQNYDGVVCIGATSDYNVPTYSDFLDANVCEFRFSSKSRHTGGFSLQTAMYGTDSKTYVYLCSMLPIDGINFYVSTPNTTATASFTIYYWDGTAFTTVGALTDGTATAGVPLSKSGTVSFASTSEIAKQSFQKNIMGYWYRIVWDTIDDTTGLFYLTTKTSIQELHDVWDGEERECVSLQISDGSTWTDYTTNVLKVDCQTYYDGTNWIYPPETYANLGTFTTGYTLAVGFISRQSGINFVLPHDQVNSNSSAVTIKYFDGSGWTSVGTVDDQTLATNSATLSHSGTMIWNNIDTNKEFKTSISTSTELYYYLITVSANLHANTKIDFVSGVASQANVDNYNSVVTWLNSLWLVGQGTGNRNKIMSSAINTMCVFNGRGSNEIFVGGNEEIIAGCSLFSRFLQNIEETMILLKKDEVWVMDGSDLDNIRPYKVSSQYGITAKNTLSVCDLGVEVTPGVNKAVAVWQSSSGIMMFDNGALITISGDIENYFKDMYDTSKTERLNPSYINKSIGFFDPHKMYYHWCFAAGTSTSLNREYVYDVIRKKWFRIDRGTGNYLQTGVYLTDINGSHYVYGAIDTGYIERLNYGNTFDGTSITSTFRMGDKPYDDTMYTESNIRYCKLLGVCNSTSGIFTLYWYPDAATTGTSVGVIDQSQSGNRVYQRLLSINKSAVFHSIGGVGVSNDTFCNSEPLAISLLFKKIRYQTNRRES